MDQLLEGYDFFREVGAESPTGKISRPWRKARMGVIVRGVVERRGEYSARLRRIFYGVWCAVGPQGYLKAV